MTSADLATRRKALGLSQRELAERLGVHPRTVAAWEAGRQQPPAYVSLALATIERGEGNARDADS